MARADSALDPDEPPHARPGWRIEHEVGIAFTGTPFRGTSIQADGSTANGATFDVGGQLDYMLGLRYVRLGVGFRTSYGTGTNDEFHYRDVERIFFVPILFGLGWWPGPRQELEVIAGIGPAWGHFASTFIPYQGSSSFDTFGPGVELTATYAFSLNEHLALFLGISARGSVGSNTRTPAAPILGEGDFHGEIPALLGLRGRLW
jgi:hypothetical protein